MSTVSFAPLWYPQKISWIFPGEHYDAPLESIRSRHARSFLQSVDTFLVEQNLRLELGPCDYSEYERFLQLYRERISEKGFDALANESWYAEKTAEGKTVEKVFLYSGEELLGGKILTVREDGIRSAFKASKQPKLFALKHNVSIGLILDYLAIRQYGAQHPELLTAGTSRNLFGVTNTIGYLIFKLRMGYIPQVVLEQTIFKQSIELPKQALWLTFLSETAATNLPLKLYSSGKIEEFPQYVELLKLIQPEPLELSR